MLFDHDGDGGLAQAVFIRGKPSGSGAECNYHFSEWHRDMVNPWGSGQGSRQTRYDLGCVSDGTDTAYRVTRVVQGVPTGTSGAVQMTKGLAPNVTLLDTTPFDIAVWSVWTPQYAGEAVDQFSDVPRIRRSSDPNVCDGYSKPVRWRFPLNSLLSRQHNQ